MLLKFLNQIRIGCAVWDDSHFFRIQELQKRELHGTCLRRPRWTPRWLHSTGKQKGQCKKSMLKFKFSQNISTHIQGVPSEHRPGLGQPWFLCYTILPCRFCQIPVSPSRVGQIVEHSKSKSTKPNLSSLGTPCTGRTMGGESQGDRFRDLLRSHGQPRALARHRHLHKLGIPRVKWHTMLLVHRIYCLKHTKTGREPLKQL